MLIFFSLIGVWLFISLSIQGIKFSQQTRFVKPESIDYFLMETVLKKVQVGADFTYRYAGKEYVKRHVFKSEGFINEYVANEWIEDKMGQHSRVYINPNSPAKAVLERVFPWKTGIQLLALLVALAYFAYLKIYTLKYV